jgi:hypothetical protein
MNTPLYTRADPSSKEKGEQGFVKHADSTWLGRTIKVITPPNNEVLHLNRGSLINYINQNLGYNEPKLKKSWLGLGLCGGASNNEIQDKLKDILARQTLNKLGVNETHIQTFAQKMNKNIEEFISHLNTEETPLSWEIISSKQNGSSLQLQLIFADESTKTKAIQKAPADSDLALKNLLPWQTQTKGIITLLSSATFIIAKTKETVDSNNPIAEAITGSALDAVFDQAMRAIQRMPKTPPVTEEYN